MIGESKKWNITEQGARDITAMRKNLDVKAAVMDSAYRCLMGAAAEYGENLGIYRDVLEAELEVIGILNKDCRESVDELRNRLEQYENLIRAEVEKAKKEAEDAAGTAGSTGGMKNARR